MHLGAGQSKDEAIDLELRALTGRPTCKSTNAQVRFWRAWTRYVSSLNRENCIWACTANAAGTRPLTFKP